MKCTSYILACTVVLCALFAQAAPLSKPYGILVLFSWKLKRMLVVHEGPEFSAVSSIAERSSASGSKWNPFFLCIRLIHRYFYPSVTREDARWFLVNSESEPEPEVVSWDTYLMKPRMQDTLSFVLFSRELCITSLDQGSMYILHASYEKNRCMNEVKLVILQGSVATVLKGVYERLL